MTVATQGGSLRWLVGVLSLGEGRIDRVCVVCWTTPKCHKVPKGIWGRGTSIWNRKEYEEPELSPQGRILSIARFRAGNKIQGLSMVAKVERAAVPPDG